MAVRRLGGRIVAFAATVALSIPLGLLTNSAWAVEDATRSDSTTQMSSTPEVVYSSAVDSKQNRTSDFDANWKFMLSDSCLLYTSPSPRDRSVSRIPSSA